MSVYKNGVLVPIAPAEHEGTHVSGGSDDIDSALAVAAMAFSKYTNTEAVAACEAAGLALASGKNIKVIANLTANQTWSGITATLQAGEIITRTELVYVKNDGKVWLAQSNAAGTMPCIAMACEATLAADAWGEFLLLGFYREDTILTFTLGDMLYVSDTVAGAFDNVLPNAGDQVQVVAKCIVGVHIVYFNPSLELVETS